MSVVLLGNLLEHRPKKKPQKLMHQSAEIQALMQIINILLWGLTCMSRYLHLLLYLWDLLFPSMS